MALDLGVQGTQISNQAAIYKLQPDARSRITTPYMVAYFLGGTALSAVTGAIYAADGWGAVCLLGAATSLLSLAAWLASGLQRR
jgi:predicted MFS family arabinose efflux permease